MRTVHFFAVFSLVSSHARALSTDAVPVAIAVRNLALVMPQRALLALPAGIALALAVDVFAALRTEHRTYTFAAVIASVAGIALAVPQQALTIAGATVRAVLGHVFRNEGIERYLLGVAVVVVDRQEPVAGLHVAGHFAAHRGMRGTRLPGVESAQHLLKVVLRVRGQRIPPGVNSDRSPPRDPVVELNVGRFRLVELHVPVAVRGDFLRQPLAQGDLREGGPIRGETPGRECSCTSIAVLLVAVRIAIAVGRRG